MIIIEELVKLVQAGDENSMKELIIRFKGFVIKYAAKYNIKGYDFEDIVQHGYLAIIKAAKKYKIGSNSFTKYCTTSIINSFKALYNGTKKHFNEVQCDNVNLLNSYEFTLDDELIAYEEVEKVIKKINLLKGNEKVVMDLVLNQNKKCREVAEVLDLDVKDIYKIKKRVISRLRKDNEFE